MDKVMHILLSLPVRTASNQFSHRHLGGGGGGGGIPEQYSLLDDSDNGVESGT